VSFLRRVFSADYRAAVAAEAAGNVDVAAERYALAGEFGSAVRMHLARAARAATRPAELAALRDAVRWAGDDAELKRIALDLGFVRVESGPLVRSSYHAHETADAYAHAARS